MEKKINENDYISMEEIEKAGLDKKKFIYRKWHAMFIDLMISIVLFMIISLFNYKSEIYTLFIMILIPFIQVIFNKFKKQSIGEMIVGIKFEKVSIKNLLLKFLFYFLFIFLCYSLIIWIIILIIDYLLGGLEFEDNYIVFIIILCLSIIIFILGSNSYIKFEKNNLVKYKIKSYSKFIVYGLYFLLFICFFVCCFFYFLHEVNDSNGAQCGTVPNEEIFLNKRYNINDLK